MDFVIGIIFRTKAWEFREFVETAIVGTIALSIEVTIEVTVVIAIKTILAKGSAGSARRAREIILVSLVFAYRVVQVFTKLFGGTAAQFVKENKGCRFGHAVEMAETKFSYTVVTQTKDATVGSEQNDVTLANSNLADLP